eukprot:3763725-Alexandrium_andersonii.AAC.1
MGGRKRQGAQDAQASSSAMNPHSVLHATHTCNCAWYRATQVAKVGLGGPCAHTHTRNDIT